MEPFEKHTTKLEELGNKLSKINFSYKIKDETSAKYWDKKIKDFEAYNKTSLEYYNQAYLLMKLVDKKDAQLFLLHTSKFRQLGLQLISMIKEIKENPTIMNSKDKQQSKWSKDARNNIINHSNKCLQHEKDMNTIFREFYEKIS